MPLSSINLLRAKPTALMGNGFTPLDVGNVIRFFTIHQRRTMKPTCDVFKAEDFSEWFFEGFGETIAERANALLAERATVVYGRKGSAPGLAGWWTCRKYSENTEFGKEETKDLTHTALLLAIQPIAKPDSAESLLRLIVSCSHHNGSLVPSEIIDRARKLLEKK